MAVSTPFPVVLFIALSLLACLFSSPVSVFVLLVHDMMFDCSCSYCVYPCVSLSPFMLTVPLTVAVFTLPLPFLGAPAPLGRGFLFGAALLLAGLLTYNSAPKPQQAPVAAADPSALQAKKQD